VAEADVAATDRAAFLALALAILGLAVTARADDKAEAALWVHADDDQLVVVHPAVSVEAGITDETHVDAHYEADVISAATVDVRTSASPRGFEETRHGINIGADQSLTRTATLGGAYTLSYSPDYMTNAGALRFALEDETRTHRFGVSLGVARDKVGRVGDDEPVGHVTSFGGAVSYGVVWSSRLVGGVSAGLEYLDGFQESPYRFVPIYRTGTEQIAIRVPESVPDQRLRGALRGGLDWALLDWLFVSGSYRFHLDDWGIAGHTVETKLSMDLGESWLLSARGRFYAQRSASFYQGRYESMPNIPEYRTRDRELAQTFAVGGGLGVGRDLVVGDWGALRLELRGDLTYRRYFDTPVLPSRLAFTGGLALIAVR